MVFSIIFRFASTQDWRFFFTFCPTIPIRFSIWLLLSGICIPFVVNSANGVTLPPVLRMNLPALLSLFFNSNSLAIAFNSSWVIPILHLSHAKSSSFLCFFTEFFNVEIILLISFLILILFSSGYCFFYK